MSKHYRRITFDCKMCDKSTMVTFLSWSHRDHFAKEFLCNKCCVRLNLSKKLFAALPKKYHKEVCKTHKVPFELLNLVKGTSSKVLIHGVCKNCGNEFNSIIRNITERHYFRNEPYCKKCLIKLVPKLPQQLLNNSKAQLIAQNTPERLNQNILTSRRLWKEGKFGLRCLRAFSKHLERMQTDPEYALTIRRNRRSIAGVVNINGHKIRFDSSYELIYLWYIKDKVDFIRRCEFRIAYGSHFYHPDFMICQNGIRKIIELKGYYEKDVYETQKAAIEYIKQTNVAEEYQLYDTNRLIKEGILQGRNSNQLWQQVRRIFKHGVITFTQDKHRQIAEIGRKKWYKERRHKTNNKEEVLRESV